MRCQWVVTSGGMRNALPIRHGSVRRLRAMRGFLELANGRQQGEAGAVFSPRHPSTESSEGQHKAAWPSASHRPRGARTSGGACGPADRAQRCAGGANQPRGAPFGGFDAGSRSAVVMQCGRTDSDARIRRLRRSTSRRATASRSRKAGGVGNNDADGGTSSVIGTSL